MTEQHQKKGRACGSAGTNCYTQLYDFQLNPLSPTAIDAEEISTAKGMRSRIDRYSMYCPLARRCFDIAREQSCDELDTMTVLAFQALAENQQLKDMILKQAHEQPATPIFLMDV